MQRSIALPARAGTPASHILRCPLGAAMLTDFAWQEVARSLRLSGRELQIVRAMFDDRTEDAIAVDLGIARRTVHTHLERLHRKLAVVDRLQLALRVVEELLSLTIAPETNLPPICAAQAVGHCPLRSRSRDLAERTSTMEPTGKR